MNRSALFDKIWLHASWLVIFFPCLMLMGKSVADAASIMLALLFLIYMILYRDFSILKEPWVRYACVLYVYLVARSLFATEPIKALFKSLPAIRFMIFACSVEYMVHSKHFNKRMIACVWIALVFLVLDCFIQFFIGHDIFGRPLFNDGSFQRLTGPFSKRVVGVVIAFFAAMVIPGLVYYMAQSRRYWLAVFLFLICAVLMLVGERGALLQFAISLNLIVAILLFKYRATVPAKVLVWTAACIKVGIVLVIGTISMLYQDVMQRQVFSVVDTVSNYKVSHHIYLWLKGLEAGLANIIFGVGPNHFQDFCEANPGQAEFICSQHPHNIYIEFFAEGGVIALFLVLLMLYEIAKKIFLALRVERDITVFVLILGSALAALQRMLPFLPSSGFFKSWYAVPTWFAIGLALGWAKRRKTNIKPLASSV